MTGKFDVATLGANVLRELDTLNASDACKKAVRAMMIQHAGRVEALQEQIEAATLVGVQAIKFKILLTDNDDRDVQVGRAVQWAVKHGLQTQSEIERERGVEYLVIDCADEFGEDF